MDDLDLDLDAVAARHGGVFSRRDALASGLRPTEVRARAGASWTVLRRGVYADRELVAALGPEARHVLEAAACVRASSLDLVASHRTAAIVHGLSLLGGVPPALEFTRPPRSPEDTSRTPGLHVATLPTGHRTLVGGVPVTTPARTAVDVTRAHGVRAGLVVADAALRRLVPAEELAAAARALRRWPGGPLGVQVAALADGRAENPLETLTRLAYRQQGLPAPESQVEVWRDGRFIALVDFLFRDQRTVGEADGMGKYDQPGALRVEKLREEALRRCGLEVVRSTWDDVWRAAGRVELGQRVREAFGYATGRPLAPGVVFRVPSLHELVEREKQRLRPAV